MDNTSSVIETILTYARLAPSGDNLQPWYTQTISDTCFDVYHQDRYTANPDLFITGIYADFGFLLEYIVITAKHFGYQAVITYNPTFHPNTDTHVARITLQKTEQKTDDVEILFTAIQHRKTSREKFQRQY